jgi:hypothetical protein
VTVKSIDSRRPAADLANRNIVVLVASTNPVVLTSFGYGEMRRSGKCSSRSVSSFNALLIVILSAPLRAHYVASSLAAGNIILALIGQGWKLTGVAHRFDGFDRLTGWAQITVDRWPSSIATSSVAIFQ